MEWPEGAELWVLKGKTTVEIDSSGLLIPTTTWDETEAGVTSRMMRMARAAEGERTYKFVSRYESYATIKLGDEVFDLEQVTVLFDGETEPTVAYKFLKRDIDKANDALKDVDVSGGLNIETEWTKNTIPVELPGKEDVVEIPVGTDGEPVLNLEYTAGEESGEANATLVIKAKPGVEEVYKINGQIVTEEGMTPTKSDTAEIVDSNDPLLTELPFTLSVPAGSKLLKDQGSKTVQDIQKDDVAVSYNKETKTFTITGNLIYNSELTDYSTNDVRKVGYFAALDLDWSKMGGEYKIELVTYKDNDPKGDVVAKPLTGTNKTELLLARVAGADGKVLDMPNRGIRLTDVRTNTSTFYKIDFSGVTCPAPELLQFSDVLNKTDAGNLLGKKAADIQTGMALTVEETSSTARTVKLTGTLHPIQGWTDFSTTEALQSGYFVAFTVDPSAISDSTFVVNNPNAEYNRTIEIKKESTLLVRVSDLAGAGEQAVSKGNATITATNGTKQVTYTLDFSGLTLEKRGSGDAKLTAAYGAVGTGFGDVKGSDFQKNLTITKTGDTFSFTGELNPIKWETGWPEDMQKGYYVFFNIDATDVAGAAAWSVRGSAGGNSPKAKEDFVFFLGDVELTKENIKSHTLYVLSEKETGSDTPAADKTLKTYKLDFSGVTLLEAEPFTVTARSADVETVVKQDLLCNMDNYKVTVDHENKKISVTGDLYAISEVYTPWAYGELKAVMGTKEDSVGYFVTFQVNASSLEEDFKFKTEGVDKKNNGQDTSGSSGVIVRVAKTGETENAAGRLLLKVGSEYEPYEFDLSGVNFKLSGDRTEPTKPTSSGNQGSTTQG